MAEGKVVAHEAKEFIIVLGEEGKVDNLERKTEEEWIKRGLRRVD